MCENNVVFLVRTDYLFREVGNPFSGQNLNLRDLKEDNNKAHHTFLLFTEHIKMIKRITVTCDIRTAYFRHGRHEERIKNVCMDKLTFWCRNYFLILAHSVYKM